MISYNDLYELLRKERHSENLQPLPSDFLISVAEFLKEKKSQNDSEEGLLLNSTIKDKKQYENGVSIFKELIRIRKKKLLNLVFVATETGMMKKDYENMLLTEKSLFDKVVKALEENDKDLTKNMSKEKEKPLSQNKMVIFNTDVEQFIDMTGNPIGPFLSGQLANMESEIAQILVTGGKARFIDES
jgi:DNA replication initiation complex subunit (GINS family)